jgi:hypothetical protein
VVAQHHHLGTSMPSGGVHTIKVPFTLVGEEQGSAYCSQMRRGPPP